MKRPTFIALVLLHLIFLFFVLLVYFMQNYLYNTLVADSIAHVYAISLFIPNIFALLSIYGIYVFFLLKSFKKKKKIDNISLHISYNIFFLFGLFIVLFKPDSTFFATQFSYYQNWLLLFLHH